MKLLLALALACPWFAHAERVRPLDRSRLDGKIAISAFASGGPAARLYDRLRGPTYLVQSPDFGAWVTTTVRFGRDPVGSFACFRVFDERSTRYSCNRLLGPVQLD